MFTKKTRIYVLALQSLCTSNPSADGRFLVCEPPKSRRVSLARSGTGRAEMRNSALPALGGRTPSYLLLIPQGRTAVGVSEMGWEGISFGLSVPLRRVAAPE